MKSLVPTYSISFIGFLLFWTDPNEKPKKNERKFLLVLLHIFPFHLFYRTIHSIHASFSYSWAGINGKKYWEKYVISAKKLLILNIMDACFEALLQFIFQINLILYELEQNCNKLSRFIFAKMIFSFIGTFFVFGSIPAIQSKS